MILKNVRVRWACVQSPNTTYEPVWSVDAVLNAEQKKLVEKNAESLNCSNKIKFKKDKDVWLLKISRLVNRVDGSENTPPVVVDKANKPFKELIGNGSLCNLHCRMFLWQNKKFGEGIGIDFKGIQVIDLVPYGEKDGSVFKTEESKSEETTDNISEEFDDESL